MDGKHDTIEERRTVVARGIDGFRLTMWDDAWKLDPERLAWVRRVSQKELKNGKWEVTLSVAERRLRELDEGSQGRHGTVEELLAALDDEAAHIAALDHWRSELEAIPVYGRGAKVGANTVIVEWGTGLAGNIQSLMALSSGNVGKIGLVRVGAIEGTVRLAVSLPSAIMDAAMERFARGEKGDTLSGCVFDAIYRAFDEERAGRESCRHEDDKIPY